MNQYKVFNICVVIFSILNIIPILFEVTVLLILIDKWDIQVLTYTIARLIMLIGIVLIIMKHKIGIFIYFSVYILLIIYNKIQGVEGFNYIDLIFQLGYGIMVYGREKNIQDKVDA